MYPYVQKFRSFITRNQGFLLWLISLWFAYRLIHNGILKFDPDGFWSPAFERWGYPDWFRILIGMLETIGGTLIIFPGVRHFGAAILFLVMLGALITRVIFGTGLDDVLSILYFALFFLYLTAYQANKNSQTSSSEVNSQQT